MKPAPTNITTWKSAPRVALYRNPRVRSGIAQALLLLVLLWLAYEFLLNAKANIEAQHIGQGFGFLANTAGFGVNQSLIAYNESDTYGRVFLVGLLNTLLVAAIGIVLATVLGFLIGIARLSSNWLLARLAGGYVELVRNLPLLFQILFWYLAVLATLPGPRQSISLWDEVYVSNRGVIVPAPVFDPGACYGGYAFLVAALASVGLRYWAKIRQEQTGQPFPVGATIMLLLSGLPLLVLALTGWPLRLERPELRGFNFVGGIRLIPEFIALLLGLTIYTAAFIAEIVRAGILAVPRGQTEAAYALGLSRSRALRLVVLPQALRVIVPPLTNQYLNLTKNSSLAVAIGYPDLVAVFAGTTLNQTGQAIEIIAITMAVYLSISLLTSAFMNWYNARIALVQR